MKTPITVPDMGEGVFEVTIARWLVKEGDVIDRYAPLAEVETDKVTTETTSEQAGTILELCAREGETVPVGGVLAYIGESDEAAATETPAAAAPPPSIAAAPGNGTGRDSGGAGTATMAGRISPVVGRMATEHGIDLARLTGTGREGRITKKDVLAYLAGQEADETAAAPTTPTGRPPQPPSTLAVPPVADLATGAYDLVPHTTMRRSIAEHMVRSKQTSPHVTTVFEFDFAAVAAHRLANKDIFARDGVRLTFMAYIVAATVQSLKAHPLVNSSWSDDGLLRHRSIHIGMATAIEDGLIVPVIKHADGMNLLGLARTINDLADRARRKQLRPDEVKGGTFSITNHGTAGSLFATPIINQPQCGILGVGAIEKRVKVIDDAIAIRPLAYVSFTFDHRILDGASADAFVATVKRTIESWR